MEMLVKLKGKISRMVIGPTLTYGAECWLIKKAQVQRMMVIEMRMIH